jgi:hypothetical protein
MQRALTWSVCVVVLIWTVSAHAAPSSLKGNYSFTGTAACLFAPGSSASPPSMGNTVPNTDAGFDMALRPVNADKSFSNSFSVSGIRTFNGDGTGTVSNATEVETTVPPTPNGLPPTAPFPKFKPSASSATFSFSFTYAVNPDGSFTSSLVPGTFMGNFLMGPRTGQTLTIDVLSFVGFTSKDSTTLTLASAGPTVETATFSSGDVWPRICHRSRVLIWLGTGG